MGLLTLHGQSALHATQTAERARTESIANVFCFTGNDKLSASNVNYTHRRRFLLVFKSLNRVKQLIDLERFLGRCETALSLAMCIQRATNWHKTCTQTSLIQAKRKIVWFDLLPSAQCLCVRSFFTHQKYIFFLNSSQLPCVCLICSLPSWRFTSLFKAMVSPSCEGETTQM